VGTDRDGVLLGASLAFAGASVLGSVVAIRDQLPGEPLGVSISLSVPAGLLAGWGAAVAAACDHQGPAVRPVPARQPPVRCGRYRFFFSFRALRINPGQYDLISDSVSARSCIGGPTGRSSGRCPG
jgi:hypothetical protein